MPRKPAAVSARLSVPGYSVPLWTAALSWSLVREADAANSSAETGQVPVSYQDPRGTAETALFMRIQ